MPLYGSSYGFGQALSGVAPAYMQGRQLGIQMQQQQLALDEAKRTAAAKQAYGEVMGMPDEQLEPQQPQPEAPQAAQGGLGYPQPPIDPNAASPFYKRANLLKRRLDLMRQKGAGMLAGDIEKQLQDTIVSHQGWMGQQAARAIETGSLDVAKQYLGAIGLPVESLAADQDDDRYVVVTAGGKAQRIPREDIALAAGGGPKALETLARVREGWGKTEQRGKAAEEREKTKRMEIERKWQEWSGEHGKQDLEWAKLDMRREQGRAQIGARYAAINKPPSNVDALYYLDMLKLGFTPQEAKSEVDKARIDIKASGKKTPEEIGASQLANFEKTWGFIKDPNVRAQRLKTYVDAARSDTGSSNPESTEPKPMPASKRPGSKKLPPPPPGASITNR